VAKATVEPSTTPKEISMKALFAFGCLTVFALLAGCAELDSAAPQSIAGIPIQHPDPVSEMTRGACCKTK
jgi:hypothetical protein